MRIRANGQPATLRNTYIHWGKSGSIHASPECGSRATRVVGTTTMVTCPKCRGRITKAVTASLDCARRVDVRGGSCGAATRPCACKVAYVDPQGRGWCKRHEPDAETKEMWAKIQAAVVTRG